MRKYSFIVLLSVCLLAVTSCGERKNKDVPVKSVTMDTSMKKQKEKEEIEEQEIKKEKESIKKSEMSSEKDTKEEQSTKKMEKKEKVQKKAYLKEEISFNPKEPYGEYSEIHSGKAVLYKNQRSDKKAYTICINAGHGTNGGERKQTLCHPDGSPKVTSGSTAKGAIKATTIASGMTFLDGTSESQVTLQAAKILRDRLLKEGYDVLMIRETEDVQLDNIARTVLANQYGDCHISLHWDSTQTDKGAFYISVPEGDYRQMEPVKSYWEMHEKLGKSLINGLRESGVKILPNEQIPIDLTQTSYSTIPSVDMELGDKASDYSKESLEKIAEGLVKGIRHYLHMCI